MKIKVNHGSLEEVVNLEINQSNVHLLLPTKISEVVAMYAEDNNCSMLESLRKFFSSDIYQQLQNEQTKLWHLGAVALYEMWQEEANSQIKLVFCR